MKPSDIAYLPVLGRPSLSDDGSVVAVTVSQVDPHTGTNSTRIWGGSTASDAIEPLTEGPDATPRVAPDGSRVAFLRPGGDGRPQVHLLDLASGQVRELTTSPLGAEALSWSPDSRTVAFVSHDITNAKAADRAIVRVRELEFYDGSVGYSAGVARCIFLVDTMTGDVRQLTFGPGDDTEPDWSPDGQHLCFIRASRGPDASPHGTDLWTARVSDGHLTHYPLDRFAAFTPRFTSDGAHIAYSGAELTETGFNDGYASFGAYVLPLEPPAGDVAQPVKISDDDSNLSYVCQVLRSHANTVYLAIDDRGRGPLVSFDQEMPGQVPQVVLDGQFQVNGFDVAGPQDSTIIACVIASPESAGDLHVKTADGLRALTSFGETLRANVSLGEAHALTSRAHDGHETSGWVFVPEGTGPHPTILIVKGGPYTQFGYTMSGPGSFEDAQLLRSHGYMVVIGNPRGAAGYGQGHVAGVRQQLPYITTVDLLGLLDLAMSQFPGDPSRIGVMGGSFGGYMAAWLLAQTDRFVGAIGERGCYDLPSYQSSSDGGVNIVHALWGDDESEWTAQSPVTYVDQINAPILLLHSDQDRHSPIEQARRLFTELKVRGKRAEMGVFPGGTHELSRSGPVHQRLARLDCILQWWAEVFETEDAHPRGGVAPRKVESRIVV